jgi:hypothetical protein
MVSIWDGIWPRVSFIILSIYTMLLTGYHTDSKDICINIESCKAVVPSIDMSADVGVAGDLWRRHEQTSKATTSARHEVLPVCVHYPNYIFEALRSRYGKSCGWKNNVLSIYCFAISAGNKWGWLMSTSWARRCDRPFLVPKQ